MPEVQAVEHADDHEGGRPRAPRSRPGPRRRARLRRPRSPARGRLRGARPRAGPDVGVGSTPGSADPASRRGVAPVRLRALDQHLVRVQRARDRAAHGGDPAVGPDRQHDRRVAVRERPLRGGDQALPEAPDLVVGDVRVGQVLEAGVDRAAAPARRPPGRRRPPRAGRRAGPRPRAGSRPRRCARARRGRPRSRAARRGRAPGRGCTCPAEQRHVHDGDRSRGVGVVPLERGRGRGWSRRARRARRSRPDRASW